MEDIKVTAEPVTDGVHLIACSLCGPLGIHLVYPDSPDGLTDAMLAHGATHVQAVA